VVVVGFKKSVGYVVVDVSRFILVVVDY